MAQSLRSMGLAGFFCLLSFTLHEVCAVRQVVHSSVAFLPEYVLRVTQEEASFACRTRLSTLVNGTLPGPPIYMKENHTTWVRVHNDMKSENLTMHWHGLSQSSAPFSDGTPLASQWPIKPGHFFDYEIRPHFGEVGTYFYHSHVGLQAISAVGAVIVASYNLQPAYHYDDERTLMISELFNKTDIVAEQGLEQGLKNFTWIGEAEALLVNGKSYSALSPEDAGTSPPYSKPAPGKEPKCGPEIISVLPDTSYRFRAIGGVGLSLVSFGIEEHNNLSVISVDGVYTAPLETDHIQIASGQRFDFVLQTKTREELERCKKTQFWIQLESRYRPTNVTSWALLSYNLTNSPKPSPAPRSPPAKKVISLTYDVQSWLEYSLKPMMPNGFPKASQVTRTVFLRAAELISTHVNWSINNRTWTEEIEHYHDTPVSDVSIDEHTPYLVDVYRHGQAAIPNYDLAVAKYDGWDPELNVYAAKVGEIIDIVLINQPNGVGGGYDTHPFHIHGGHVYDLGSGPGEYDAAANEKRLEGYNPVLRDTTMLYKYSTTDLVGTGLNYTDQGWRAWRLNVTDPGVWMLHCHILPHMIMGMQSVWVMGNATQITHGTSPDIMSGYLTYGGNAYGNASYDPLVTHHYPEN